MALKQRSLLAVSILLGLSAVGVGALVLSSIDFVLLNHNEKLRRQQAHFHLYWTASSIQEILPIYPRLERWQVIDSKQVVGRHATHLACLEDKPRHLRLLLWLDRNDCIVRYLWLTDSRGVSNDVLPSIQLTSTHSATQRSLGARFSPCGFAELYTPLRQVNNWQISKGCRLDKYKNASVVYFEPRLVLEQDPRVSVWFFWETDNTGCILNRTVHGSW